MYNILVCDDEKDIVSALKIYLSSGNSGSQEGTVLLPKKHLTVSGNILGCHNLVGEGEMSLASGG